MSVSKGLRLFALRMSSVKEQLFSPKHLVYTNVGISMSLSAVGDVLEQHYEILKNEWSGWCPKRTAHMTISGMSVGLFCHYWYKILDAKLPGKTVKIVLKKVAVDQLICSPIYIGIFFLTLAFLEQRNWSELKIEVTNKAHKLYIAEWIVWPPAQIINFYFLPSRFRVLYDSTISLGYDIYTSQVKHKH
ncbi:mpv17-like protein 2 [Microplitis demolitor]|uniref:mpv17-like protein 2 n=1 Tax=Microplitis demolitor TaxID=69319 RepID=UPI0004CD06F5|nr:mpv17-like protein 2 [Microplitis demolitor]XP_008549982.1 mpv17-like protein 2 [Microplitis demolitor]XP_014300623.1 mpv17-like protein 2 [Microplitis demolitor]